MESPGFVDSAQQLLGHQALQPATDLQADLQGQLQAERHLQQAGHQTARYRCELHQTWMPSQRRS